jgi:AcrR family transcriptional regulator
VPDLREQVLAASLALIEEQGVAALSLREVARRAGVSHQAPYHHFGRKEAIVAELVARGFAKLSDMLEQAEAARGSASRRLGLAGRAYVDFAIGDPASFRLMFRPELTGAGAFPATAAESRRAYDALVRLVDAQFARPRVPKKKLDALVTLHWSVVHGLATLVLDGSLGKQCQNRRALDAHIDLTLELLTRAAASLEP